MSALWAIAPDTIGEVSEGTDLADLVLQHLELEDGDVVVLTSKVVSKAEGRVITGDRDDAIVAETVRVVARRGTTTIVENHLGLVMAAAGIDASNVTPGHLVLLPRDPDATARSLRTEIADRTDRNVAVLISDTCGRPWRQGQTDIAIGAAGLHAVQSLAGELDTHGNSLAVTAPAVADEICGLAELVTGKQGGRPLTLVRGLAGHVLPPGEHGAGAHAVVRPAAEDMFALGTREAVEAALRGERSHFGAASDAADLLAALNRCGVAATLAGDAIEVSDATRALHVEPLATAHGWVRVDNSARFRRPL